ncbi:MAG: DUF4922 domain-containing protein [Bacteroidaceae bacterium]
MKQNKIDCFIPYAPREDLEITLSEIGNSSLINTIYILIPENKECCIPKGCVPLKMDALQSTKAIKTIARKAEAGYALFYVKTTPLELGYRALERLINVAQDAKAQMVYADHYIVESGVRKFCPVIDYQEGSLRNDFDFGSLLLLNVQSLKLFAESHFAVRYQYAGFYSLRLFLSRIGLLLHLNEPLYTEQEMDTRKSGEKQFDYVNPSQRVVQVEMERACTDHLKEIGAYLAPDEYDEIKFHSNDFPVEASVVIPVRNRVSTIKDAINSVLSQKTNFSFNILVVDNHSTDGTSEAIDSLCSDKRIVHILPERDDLGIGGCWNLAANTAACGRFCVQLDSDDLYSSVNTLQIMVSAFYEQGAAMVIGSYRMVDFTLNTLPPGLIDHREWTPENGRNNALRINGLGAPRAFYTPILRDICAPNTCYGEDYALGLAFSRRYRIGRIYDELYLCRRWDGNSDAALSIDKVNANNLYKDRLRSIEIWQRKQMNELWQTPLVEKEVQQFFQNQLKGWDDAAKRIQDLKQVRTKKLEEGELKIEAQFNPSRIVSTAAKVDKKSLEARPCFLCDLNRPKMQLSMPVEGLYQVLVNPFPILPCHLTVPLRRHLPQLLDTHIGAFCRLVWQMPESIVFYNGAHCGASAPDHFHFQTGGRGVLPIERYWNRYSRCLEKIYPFSRQEESELEENGYTGKDDGIFLLKNYVCPAFVVRTTQVSEEGILIRKLLSVMPLEKGEKEPRINVIGWHQTGGAGREDELIIVIFPRKKHRPDCYNKEGKKQFLLSPGSLDMGGLLILPREEDFNKITPRIAFSVLKEVTRSEKEVTQIAKKLQTSNLSLPINTMGASIRSLWKEEPNVSVGIMSSPQIEFSLNGNYIAKGEVVNGEQKAKCCDGCILWQGNLYSELTFVPQENNISFSLANVLIGVDFHWERREVQTFAGALKLLVEDDKIIAINVVSVENYLTSVISSEMRATSSLEFLKASAIISRSWLFAQMEKRRQMKEVEQSFFSFIRNDTEYIKWYGREDHILFDVCADDHCQRYQGITRASNITVKQAVEATRGQVLMNDKDLCDARFSKCCGGISEEYASCWEDKNMPYLASVRDNAIEPNLKPMPNLTLEVEAEQWIRSAPTSFCNTTDKNVLSQVLNDYDQETTNFYRWKQHFSQQELAALIRTKRKEDFGDILDLQPIERGKSGRLSKLKIVGSKKTLIIGKELEIRRSLSPSHLYSSAFVVDKGEIKDGIPQTFTLTGAGWGHGVGMCQIGAAVMGEKGFSYDEILLHYYQGSTIKTMYK